MAFPPLTKFGIMNQWLFGETLTKYYFSSIAVLNYHHSFLTGMFQALQFMCGCVIDHVLICMSENTGGNPHQPACNHFNSVIRYRGRVSQKGMSSSSPPPFLIFFLFKEMLSTFWESRTMVRSRRCSAGEMDTIQSVSVPYF